MSAKLEAAKLTPFDTARKYRFMYPKEFVTLPKYSAKHGVVVRVTRQLTQDEADQGEGMERMFEITDDTGWIGHAWESELVEVVT